MVFMPPRHGKSELVSRLFSAYYLYRHPERWVGINSYAAELAYTLSRAARDHYLASGGRLRDDAAAVKHWETGQGGGLWAAGVGGPITGKGFHLGLIDDPLKNEEEAASETIRRKQKEWYGSTFYTREEVDEEAGVRGAIVVVQTRWNEDDLSGWLLAEEEAEDEEGEGAERWHIVSFEAIKEDEPPEFPATCTVEPDWREVGEALCPERRPLERLRKIARRIGGYFFAALFQQRPRPREGGLFRWDDFVIVDALPVELPSELIRYWDLAGTEGAGDFTRGVLGGLLPDGFFYVIDARGGQWGVSRRDAQIKETADEDRAAFGWRVTQWFERQAGIGGTDATEAIVRMLHGHRVQTEPATGSKEVRAEPLASQVGVRNVRLLRGAWNTWFRRELCDFPHAKHDDAVDAAAGCYNKAALGRGGATTMRFKV